MALLGAEGSGEPLQKLFYPCSDSGLPRHDFPVFSFEGFPDSSSDPESSLSRRRVLLLARTAAQSLEVSVGSHVVAVCSHSRVSSSHAVFATPSQHVRSSVVGGPADLLGRLLPPGSPVVVRCQPSRGRSLPRAAPTEAASLHRRFGHGLGCIARCRPPVRLVVSGCFEVFDQPPRTPGHVVGNPWLPPSLQGPLCVALHRQQDVALLPAQGGGHALFNPQCGGPSYPLPLRDISVRMLPQFVSGHLNILADSLSRGSQVLGSEWTLCMEVCRELSRRWPVTVDLFATSLNHRLQVYFSPMADRQAAGIDAMLQSWDYLQVYAFPPSDFIQRVLTKVHQSRNLEVTLVAPFWPPEAVVPGSLRAPSGSASPSACAEGSSPSTAHPSFPSQPPRARSNWLLHCERSACHFGFSSRMARQLSFCRRSLTLVNYQAKWTTYCSWCHSHGHSISRPSISKVADFLLYLCRSLHLSYSSIASYRSMLSVAFRFVLPELSSHPVLHDLLRSFRIGIHITCTTDTAQTLTHPTLMYNIFTSALGTKCTLPVSYARQQPWAAPAKPHLTHHFIYSRHRVRCSSAYSFTQNTLSDFRCRPFGLFWIWTCVDLIIMDSRPPSTSASATSTSSSASSPALDSAVRRSCTKCSRRISSYTHDKHALCLHCRDVLCSMDVRCRECSNWSTEDMLEHLKHGKSLVSKGKKHSLVATPTSASPSVSPSVTPVQVSASSSQVASTVSSIPSLASEEGLKFVHSVLVSLLSQPSVSLGTNPFIPASSAEVPDMSRSGSAGGSEGDNLLRGRPVAPSGMVPPPPQEDVCPPPPPEMCLLLCQ